MSGPVKEEVNEEPRKYFVTLCPLPRPRTSAAMVIEALSQEVRVLGLG